MVTIVQAHVCLSSRLYHGFVSGVVNRAPCNYIVIACQSIRTTYEFVCVYVKCAQCVCVCQRFALFTGHSFGGADFTIRCVFGGFGCVCVCVCECLQHPHFISNIAHCWCTYAQTHATAKMTYSSPRQSDHLRNIIQTMAYGHSLHFRPYDWSAGLFCEQYWMPIGQ